MIISSAFSPVGADVECRLSPADPLHGRKAVLCETPVPPPLRRITGIRGDPDHPANFGRLCSKGSTLHLTTQITGRALYPEFRLSRSDPRTKVTWDDALDTAAKKFAGIIKDHGPDAVAFYISGQLLTEDYYVFNKLARALIGTNNIDSNSRLCMSSAVAGYKATLGSDAVPCSYEDIALADLFLLTGSNTAWAHPIVFRRIEAAKAANPNLRIIVIDPRKTDTAAMADMHLAITPGSDVILYAAMLHVLLWEGFVDRDFIAAHTTGFDALRAQVSEVTPGAAAAVCGVTAEQIVQAARWFGEAKTPLSLWCQGLNQSIHGTSNNAALIHLHLATGKIGKPGMGPFSLTGQPNAMGGREVGAMANLLPGHRALDNPSDRAELAALWGVPALSSAPGKTAVEMFDSIREGKIKAVWIACTNPAHSLPDQAKVREALLAAEFVVVQDCFADTETCNYADLLLPAATWGEKDGTMTNSERRISRVRKAVDAPGDARPDWEIVVDFARRLEVKLASSVGAGVESRLRTAEPLHGREAVLCETPASPPLFPFTTAAQIYDEHAMLTLGRDLDIGGLSHAKLDELGPQQWPFASTAAAGTPRLYQDNKFATPDGRARFAKLDLRLTAESPDAKYPIRLTTGRLRDQWHGMSRTGRSARLYAHEATPRLMVHASDLARRGMSNGQLARISSRRGSVVLPVQSGDEVQPGQAFAAMHWGARSLSNAGINELMQAAIDPTSKQPELKHAAIRIEVAELPWRVVALRASPTSTTAGEDKLLHWRNRLSPLLGQFDYAALTLAGRDDALLKLQIASAAPLPADALAKLCTALEFDVSRMTNYTDQSRNIIKHADIDNTSGQINGLLFAGEIAATDWLANLMLARQPLGESLRYLFAPTAKIPNAPPAASRTICNCFGITEAQILSVIESGADLPALQSQLNCGTECGSCLPELKRMTARYQH
ncbi:MAG: molybdopterin-dependent oxidoreductase [Rhodocyclaceae bacterium]|nr:molybdopterin-dependent oxidoreductase [Rhodocyclaceae bacterium]